MGRTQTYRQADRQTDRQTHTHTHIHTIDMRLDTNGYMYFGNAKLKL